MTSSVAPPGLGERGGVNCCGNWEKQAGGASGGGPGGSGRPPTGTGPSPRGAPPGTALPTLMALCISANIRCFSRLGMRPKRTASRDMPTSRHFLKRHCWQRLRLMRTMEQFSFFRHFLYWMFCWMLRRKNPLQPSQACTP